MLATTALSGSPTAGFLLLLRTSITLTTRIGVGSSGFVGGVRNNVYINSYGMFALRGLLTLAVRISWGRVVAWTATSTASTVWTIPTAGMITDGFALRGPMTLATRG